MKEEIDASAYVHCKMQRDLLGGSYHSGECRSSGAALLARDSMSANAGFSRVERSRAIRVQLLLELSPTISRAVERAHA